MGHLLRLTRQRIVAVDAVGTLIVPAEPVAETYVRWGQRFGSRLSQAEIAERFARNFQQLCRAPVVASTSEEAERMRWQSLVGRVFEDVTHATGDLFESLWHHYAAPAAWRIAPDGQRLIQVLEQLRLRWGIASNFDHRLHELVAQFQPLTLADFVLTSSELGWGKSSPEFYREAQRRLQDQSGAAVAGKPLAPLMIGDDPHNDVDSAVQAGWEAVLVIPPGERPGPNRGELWAGTLGRIADLLGQCNVLSGSTDGPDSCPGTPD